MSQWLGYVHLWCWHVQQLPFTIRWGVGSFATKYNKKYNTKNVTLHTILDLVLHLRVDAAVKPGVSKHDCL